MPAPLAGIVPILMNSARGLKILRDLGIAVTSIPAIEKTINAIPEEKQKQLVELIVQGPAYDFVNEQVFRNVKDTPSGTVIGPDADEIEKQKEQIQKDLKPPKAGEPPSIEPLITLPPEPMETKEEFPAEEDDKPLIETFPAGTEQGPVIFTMDDPRQIKTTGQYVGLPEGTDTKEKLQEIRDEAYKQFDSGKEGRYWYRDSAKTILDSVGGNIAEADKIAQLIGVFSAGSPVGTDLNYALQAYAAHKRGEDIFTGRFPTAQSQKAKTILEGGTWEGRKTNNFYKAIAREFNPELSNEPVVDIWMMRAFGFEDFDGTPTEAQYNTVSNEIKNILGKAREIDPSYDINQIQAAIWVGAKAKKVGSMDKALFNYQNAIENNLGQISWESAPGGSLNHLVGFGDLPYKDRQEYHVEASKIFLDDKGNDILAQAIGVLTPNEFEAPGHYMDEVNPGSQTEVIIPKGYKETKALDKNTVALIDAYAAAKGLILGQEAVPWHRPFYTDSANKADGVKITIDDGRIATQAETRQLSQEANKIASEIAGREINDFNLIGSEDGGRFLNVVFDDAGNKVFTNKQFTDIISKAADRVFPGEQKVDLNYFASDGNYISNDWNKNLNGEDYIKTIGQAGSDIQKRVLDLLPSLIEKKYQLDKGFGEKYKLELNTAINQKYRTSGGTRGGGTPGQVQGVIDKSGVAQPVITYSEEFPKDAKDLLKRSVGSEKGNKAIKKIFDDSIFDDVLEPSELNRIKQLEDSYVGGLADTGDSAIPTIFENTMLDQHEDYMEDYKDALANAARETLGNEFKAYRLMEKEDALKMLIDGEFPNIKRLQENEEGEDVYQDVIVDMMGEKTPLSREAFSFSLNPNDALAFRFMTAGGRAYKKDEDFVLIEMKASPTDIIMRGHESEKDLVLRVDGETAGSRYVTPNLFNVYDIQFGEKNKVELSENELFKKFVEQSKQKTKKIMKE